MGIVQARNVVVKENCLYHWLLLCFCRALACGTGAPLFLRLLSSVTIL